VYNEIILRKKRFFTGKGMYLGKIRAVERPNLIMVVVFPVFFMFLENN
jgi:hypothetical protein